MFNNIVEVKRYAPIYCPYCCRVSTIVSIGDVSEIDKEIKCDFCKRKFKLSELPLNTPTQG